METAAGTVAKPEAPSAGPLDAVKNFAFSPWVWGFVILVALAIYFVTGSDDDFAGKDAGGAPEDTDSDPDVMRLVSAINS
ncbi:MAG: hypothetical protein QF464_01875 [Myxococcota bacterium]|jgi:hypothetical protein|nr:hypothetical protein [Myxococcota bacterium]